MNFDFSDDQKLLQTTARDYLLDNCPLSVARGVLESGAGYSGEVWKGAAQMGWLGTAVPEQYGGAGFGHLELALVAQELGRALAPIPFSSSVYLATEAILIAGSEEQKRRHLPGLAAGETIGTLALAERPGRHGTKGFATAFAGGRLNGRKVPVADGVAADLAVVAATSGDGTVLVLVECGQSGVTKTAAESLAPSRPLAKLDFRDASAEPLGVPGAGGDILRHLLDRAAVLMAFEQLGGAERALELTRDYCMGRYAFGRRIASFQALKHRLADVYVAIELARSNSYYGAWALGHDSPDLAVAACGARASATDAFDLAAEEMVQLHGGVGFTWEYDCHLFYRRAAHLGLALGSAAQWKDMLVRRLAERAATPPPGGGSAPQGHN